MSAILIGRSKSMGIGRTESVAGNSARDWRVLVGRQYDARLTTAASVALASGFASTLASTSIFQVRVAPKVQRCASNNVSEVAGIPARSLLSVVAAIDKTMGAGSDLHPTVFAVKEGRRHVARLIERGIK